MAPADKSGPLPRMPILRIKLPDRPVDVTHVLEGERITVGRGPDNTIQINDRTVSKHHAELLAVHGHYRLHDLDATNRTCVDGQPVTDFHLLENCQVLFGTVEAEFSPEMPTEQDKRNGEWVPTLAEFEFMKRENRELQMQILAFERRIEILGSAPLVTRQNTVLAISPDVHARVVAERDNLQKENADLQFDMENLRCDLAAIMRERDALRQAWATVRAELSGVEEELARLRQDLNPGLQETDTETGDVPPNEAPVVAVDPIAIDSHHLAELLNTAPEVIESLRRDLKLLSASPLDETSRNETARHAAALVEVTRGIQGHPIERLAVHIDALLSDITTCAVAFAWTALATVKEALNLVSALLNPDAFRQASDVPPPRVLAVENDAELLIRLVAALKGAGIATVTQSDPASAASQLLKTEFDLVLVDNEFPGVDALDFCNEIRALPGHSRTPILFLTAADTVDGRAESLLAGGSDFLRKPFNILELTLKAETWIYRKQFGLLPRGIDMGPSGSGSIEIGLEALRQLP
jgi:CheY-like chemotaxis protein